MTTIEHLNPEGLASNPAFTHAVVVAGPHRTVYVGGQNALDEHGDVVGRGDIAAQARQVFANLRSALRAGGADLEHVVRWNIALLHGQPIEAGFAVFQEEWGARGNPPAISMSFVPALAHPDYLVEIDAVAVVPE